MKNGESAYRKIDHFFVYFILKAYVVLAIWIYGIGRNNNEIQDDSA